MVTKERLQRQIYKCKEKLNDLKSREEHLSKHGHWDMGYFQGKLSVLEDWLDEIEEKE
jgi:hypothetical protein